MDEDCLFCKIISKALPSKMIYEDQDLIVIEDINPQAPVHLLLIPKVHRGSVMDLADSDQNLMGSLILKIKEIAGKKGIGQSGFRLALNCGEEGGQTVSHIHFHLMGGRRLRWPPG